MKSVRLFFFFVLVLLFLTSVCGKKEKETSKTFKSLKKSKPSKTPKSSKTSKKSKTSQSFLSDKKNKNLFKKCAKFCCKGTRFGRCKSFNFKKCNKIWKKCKRLTTTIHPTMNPTNNPTNNPSLKPSFNPSIIPSFNPSSNPTSNPSLNPTMNPTFENSAQPGISYYLVLIANNNNEHENFGVILMNFINQNIILNNITSEIINLNSHIFKKNITFQLPLNVRKVSKACNGFEVNLNNGYLMNGFSTDSSDADISTSDCGQIMHIFVRLIIVNNDANNNWLSGFSTLPWFARPDYNDPPNIIQYTPMDRSSENFIIQILHNTVSGITAWRLAAIGRNIPSSINIEGFYKITKVIQIDTWYYVKYHNTSNDVTKYMIAQQNNDFIQKTNNNTSDRTKFKFQLMDGINGYYSMQQYSTGKYVHSDCLVSIITKHSTYHMTVSKNNNPLWYFEFDKLNDIITIKMNFHNSNSLPTGDIDKYWVDINCFEDDTDYITLTDTKPDYDTEYLTLEKA